MMTVLKVHVCIFPLQLVGDVNNIYDTIFVTVNHRGVCAVPVVAVPLLWPGSDSR